MPKKLTQPIRPHNMKREKQTYTCPHNANLQTHLTEH
jgi:hypothetical protein